MDEKKFLAEQFEHERSRLRAVAYRMLGSHSEADDAVQEAWLHLSRADTRSVTNLGGWLTTVVARVCLDWLRARKARREEPLGMDLPAPVGVGEEANDPEHAAILADAVSTPFGAVVHTGQVRIGEAVGVWGVGGVGTHIVQLARLVGANPIIALDLEEAVRERALELGAELAGLTHGHPTGRIAAGAFAALVALLVRDFALPEAVERVGALLPRYPGHAETARAFASAASLASLAWISMCASAKALASLSAMAIESGSSPVAHGIDQIRMVRRCRSIRRGMMTVASARK